MKFSIITVCFNAAEKIENTIKSVLNQNYGNVEYIIVDGASSDGTREIIEKYAGENGNDSCKVNDGNDVSDGCNGRNGCKVSLKFVSEPDNGLYDAMNKGVRMASGDYVEFLNAGDEFYDENVLEKVAERIREADCSCATEVNGETGDVAVGEAKDDAGSGVRDDAGSGVRDDAGDKAGDEVITEKNIYYGNILYMNPDGSTSVRLYGKSCGKAIYFATGDCVNHQAIFASRSTLVAEGPEALISQTRKSQTGESKIEKSTIKEPKIEKSTIKEPKIREAKAFCDDEFKICADRDWMMRVTKGGAKWISLDEIVVKYDLSEESISVRDAQGLRREERLCLKKNYPMLLPIYGVFDFCRHNKTLAKILHGVYEKLYLR